MHNFVGLQPYGDNQQLRMQFFLSATFFTDKQATVTGWRGPKAAHKLVNESLTGRNS
jgi:hypothetical protein